MKAQVLGNTPQMIGQSAAFLDLLDHTSKLAPTDFPVIIHGERGTGKELIAHRLHFLSGRWEQSFVKVNCAAMTTSLLESELFGHEAGSFTGAKGRRIGRIERAHGGTLFLDELAAASDALQEKLLRVIEYGELERIGGEQSLQVDVRFVAASHEDLWQLAEKGQFRKDLLDRLAFDLITIPPLRDRTDDILPLAEYLAVKISQELGRDFFQGFSAEAQQILLAYPWPGNVRQLRNVVGRSLFHHESADMLTKIRFLPHEQAAEMMQAREKLSTSTASELEMDQLTSKFPDQLTWIQELLSQTMELGFYQALEIAESQVISAAIAAVDGNQTVAAQNLGLTYHQLRGLVRKYQNFNKPPIKSSKWQTSQNRHDFEERL